MKNKPAILGGDKTRKTSLSKRITIGNEEKKARYLYTQ